MVGGKTEITNRTKTSPDSKNWQPCSLCPWDCSWSSVVVLSLKVSVVRWSLHCLIFNHYRAKKKTPKNNNNKQITSPSPKKMFYLTPVSLPDCWRWQVSKLWTWLFAWTGLAWLNLWLESLKVSPNPDQRTVFGLHTPLNSFHRSEEVCLWHYIQFPSYAHIPNSQ